MSEIYRLTNSIKSISEGFFHPIEIGGERIYVHDSLITNDNTVEFPIENAYVGLMNKNSNVIAIRPFIELITNIGTVHIVKKHVAGYIDIDVESEYLYKVWHDTEDETTYAIINGNPEIKVVWTEYTNVVSEVRYGR